MIPYSIDGVCFTLKDFVFMVLPDVPNEKAEDELPESVENGVFKRMSVLVLDGV